MPSNSHHTSQLSVRSIDTDIDPGSDSDTDQDGDEDEFSYHSIDKDDHSENGLDLFNSQFSKLSVKPIDEGSFTDETESSGSNIVSSIREGPYNTDNTGKDSGDTDGDNVKNRTDVEDVSIDLSLGFYFCFIMLSQSPPTWNHLDPAATVQFTIDTSTNLPLTRAVMPFSANASEFGPVASGKTLYSTSQISYAQTHAQSWRLLLPT